MGPMSILIKPASGSCNMRCTYCFYADEMANREIPCYNMMTEETIEIVLKKVLANSQHLCNIMFQGGEPTLVGISFYEKVIKYVKKYNVNKCKISYGLQTNGYNLDTKWAKFFSKNNFLVGISLDGYEELHNIYRVDAKGKGTYKEVMRTIDLFNKYRVEYNVLTVVHEETTKHTSQIYDFFKSNNFGFQQYIECLDPIGKKGEVEYSLSAASYGEFLKELFDKWHDDLLKGRYTYIRYFENLLLIMLKRPPESCNMVGQCSKQWVIEADGSVYVCDFYVLDEWKIGNLKDDSILEIEAKRDELDFINRSKYIPDECKSCNWYGLCRNGCMRHCGEGDNRSVNYYCEAYKMFFEHAYPRLYQIANMFR